MSGPAKLHLKRKREDEPPGVLILQDRLTKRATTHHLRYVRQASPTDDTRNGHTVPVKRNGTSRAISRRRVFELTRKRREGGQDEVATISEKMNGRSDDLEMLDADGVAESDIVPPKETYKRPSKQTLRKPVHESNNGAETPENRAQMQELAEYMQRTVLEGVEREDKSDQSYQPNTSWMSKPRRVVSPPKLSGKQSREIHQRRAAAQATPRFLQHSPAVDGEEEESEYVYDTYILAPTTPESSEHMDNVGYLELTEADEAIWETYREDADSDERDWNSEEEDENAEDFYGADYPEDELDWADEFDRGAYRYRAGAASDDEDGVLSDDSGDDEEDEEEQHQLSVLNYRKTTAALARSGLISAGE